MSSVLISKLKPREINRHIVTRLRSLETAFNVVLKPYRNVAEDAIKKNDECHDPDQVLFIDRSIKDLNMAEVKNLLNLDTQYSHVKFKLFTENTNLKESSVNPSFRRLLNNGLNYGIYMNSPQQTWRYLKSLDDVEREVRQVYMQETVNSQGTAKFLEVKHHNTFRVPLTIEGKEYQLETPSIALLSKMKGVGVPENHPDFNTLKVLGSIVDPLNKKRHIEIIPLDASDSENLLAIVPTHILSHQSLIPSKTDVPEQVVFEKQSYTYAELSAKLAPAFKTSPPLFEITPFIVQKHLVHGEEITIALNQYEVLRRDRFPNLQAVPDGPITLWRRTKSEAGLNFIPNTYVAKCINPKPHRNPQSQAEVIVNSDILRSAILQNESTPNHIFKDREATLELLTGAMEIWCSKYSMEGEELVWDMSPLVEQFHDYSFLEQFNKLNNGQLQLGDFATEMVNYIVVDSLMRESHSSITNPFLFNIMVRLLNDHVRFHFPEFSSYYLQFSEQASTKLEPPESAGKFRQNKWQNYIRYPLTPLPPAPTETQQNKYITSMITEIIGIKRLPPPYLVKVMVVSKVDLKESLALLNRAATVVTSANVILNPDKAITKHVEIDKMIFKAPNIKINNIFDAKSALDAEQWVGRLKPLEFLENLGGDDLSTFKNKFREAAQQDLEWNVFPLIVADNALNEKIRNKMMKRIERFVDKIVRLIEEDFVEEFRQIYSKSEIIGAKDMQQIGDADSKVNEFKELV